MNSIRRIVDSICTEAAEHGGIPEVPGASRCWRCPVCAYLARADTMRDARLLGSADIPFLEQAGPEAWPRWRQCMADLFADLMKEALGARPIMPDPVPAPEHERSGRG